MLDSDEFAVLVSRADGFRRRLRYQDEAMRLRESERTGMAKRPRTCYIAVEMTGGPESNFEVRVVRTQGESVGTNFAGPVEIVSDSPTRYLSPSLETSEKVGIVWLGPNRSIRCRRTPTSSIGEEVSSLKGTCKVKPEVFTRS